VKYDQQAAQLFEVFIRAIDEPEAFPKVVKSLLEFCFQRLIASGRSSPTRSTTAVPTNLLRSNPFKFIVLGILRLRKSFVCIKSPRIVRGDFNYYVVPGKTASLGMFCHRLLVHWWHSVRHRSQKPRIYWTRMLALADDRGF